MSSSAASAALIGVAEVAEDGVRAGVPGVQVAVIRDGALLHHSAHGQAQRDTRMDLASLTKLLATTLAAAALVARGELRLDARVAELLPAFQGEGSARVTVGDLLRHRSGFAAWKPFFAPHFAADVDGALLAAPGPARAALLASLRPKVIERVLAEPLAPPGVRAYSDLGFIALGELLAAVSAGSLDALASREVFVPLGLKSLGFRDLRQPLTGGRFLATGRTRPREPAPGQEALVVVPTQTPVERAGEVDDDNAWILGGVAGHAGLFGDALDVARVGAAILANVFGDASWMPAGFLGDWVVPDLSTAGAPRGLGFDRVAGEGSTAGTLFGRWGPLGGAGHLGFTGCSLWLDLDRRVSVALLTNRTLAGRAQTQAIRRLRPALHDAVMRAL